MNLETRKLSVNKKTKAIIRYLYGNKTPNKRETFDEITSFAVADSVFIQCARRWYKSGQIDRDTVRSLLAASEASILGEKKRKTRPKTCANALPK